MWPGFSSIQIPQEWSKLEVASLAKSAGKKAHGSVPAGPTRAARIRQIIEDDDTPQKGHQLEGSVVQVLAANLHNLPSAVPPLKIRPSLNMHPGLQRSAMSSLLGPRIISSRKKKRRKLQRLIASGT